jgi:phytoene synthase
VCRDLALRHYENFPVGRFGVPRDRRPDIHAVYAFARMADDFADEPQYEGKRLALLDDWGKKLESCLTSPEEPVFVALGDTIRRLQLPLDPFRDLLSAFRQDVGTPRYAHWNDVLDYCRRSANPIGRLVLAVTGQESPEALALSDDLCTALQLTNFWQDLSVDHPRGRSYLPKADAAMFGVDLERLVAGDPNGDVEQLLEVVGDRTANLYESAQPLLKMLKGGLRIEITATWLGGSQILEESMALGAEALSDRPELHNFDKALIAAKAVLGLV